MYNVTFFLNDPVEQCTLVHTIKCTLAWLLLLSPLPLLPLDLLEEVAELCGVESIIQIPDSGQQR